MSLRFYLYISDGKVDQLLPQVARSFGDRRRTEFRGGFKGLGARYEREDAAGTDRVLRLQEALNKLEQNADVGPVEEPRAYVHGRMAMRWDVLTAGDDSSLVFFGGRDVGTVVGLGGSVRHVVGARPDAQGHGQLSPSVLPGMLRGLRTDAHGIDAFEDGEGETDADAAEFALWAVLRAVDALRGPVQNVEFVAKRLLHGPVRQSEDAVPVVLGSPLYVALTD